jgi:hypothetical protein
VYACATGSCTTHVVTEGHVIPSEVSMGCSLRRPRPITIENPTTTKKKAREKAGHAQNLFPIRTASGHGHFRSRDFVTSCQKIPLGRIWLNFRLRMRRTYFRAGPFPLTWLTSLYCIP